MNWTSFLMLGSLFVGTTLGWTYHYSRKTMNWTQARQWCQTSYTDMVVIQNQGENDYLVSKLPNRSKSPYYWIGITKNHKNETWTWIGNNSTWIGEQSWAANEPNNNHSTEFCVEIYVNKDANRGKWNDEKCANRKYAVCYKAQCNATSCERGQCQETIENITCLCEPGFVGDRCQTAITSNQKEQTVIVQSGTLNGNKTLWRPDIELKAECTPLPQPDNGRLSCSGGNNTFNSTCRLKCFSGFLMIGLSTVTCGDKGNWSGPRPVCTSYKQALFAVAGCGALSAFCCICFCWMERRKRKKLAQVRQSEEASPSSEAQEIKNDWN